MTEREPLYASTGGANGGGDGGTSVLIRLVVGLRFGRSERVLTDVSNGETWALFSSRLLLEDFEKRPERSDYGRRREPEDVFLTCACSED